jgi:very-short-patch-repair endonuclease
MQNGKRKTGNYEEKKKERPATIKIQSKKVMRVQNKEIKMNEKRWQTQPLV